MVFRTVSWIVLSVKLKVLPIIILAVEGFITEWAGR